MDIYTLPEEFDSLRTFIPDEDYEFLPLEHDIPWNKGLAKEDQPWYGRKHSEETKLKISIANKGNQYHSGKNHTEETKLKISESKTGTILSDEHKMKIGQAQKGRVPSENQRKLVSVKVARTYELIDPEGNKFIVTNLAKYCRDNNLASCNLVRNLVKGWSCRKI